MSHYTFLELHSIKDGAVAVITQDAFGEFEAKQIELELLAAAEEANFRLVPEVMAFGGRFRECVDIMQRFSDQDPGNDRVPAADASSTAASSTRRGCWGISGSFKSLVRKAPNPMNQNRAVSEDHEVSTIRAKHTGRTPPQEASLQSLTLR